MEKELTPRTQGKIRLTIDLTPEFHDRLTKLETRTYLGSKATVVRHALSLYEQLITLAEEGAEIVVRTPSGQEHHLNRATLAIA